MNALADNAIIGAEPPGVDSVEHCLPFANLCSSPDEKIALLRLLFRGRNDVYPRRFESRKTGKSGYAPACANEWVPGICEKPRVKCAECPHRRFLPVTDDVIRWHLSGHDAEGKPFVAGVYPLLLDETCFSLAIDFDQGELARGLDGVPRISRGELEHLVDAAERRRRVLGVGLPPEEDDERTPWTTSPSRRPKVSAIAGALPPSIELVFGNAGFASKRRRRPKRAWRRRRHSRPMSCSSTWSCRTWMASGSSSHCID